MKATIMTDTNKETEISPKETPAKRAATKKTPSNKSTLPNSGNEALYKMIQDAAYFIAEHNNFYGDPQSFWLKAETQINGSSSL
jgi:hypothetical protein